MKDKLLKLLVQKKKKYEKITDEIDLLKSNGNLSILCNLRTEFNETFDQFFDDKELRKKYNAWDYINNIPNYDISSTDLEKMLKESDLQNLIKFYDNAIQENKIVLERLKGENR